MAQELQSCNIDGLTLAYRPNTHDKAILDEIWVEHYYDEDFPKGQKAMVVDIGAHNGYFSIYAARQTAVGSRIFAYEPTRDNFAILKHNLESNKIAQVSAHNTAVAGHNGQLELFLNAAHTGGHSVFRERVEVYGPGAARPIQVPCISLDSAFEAIGGPVDFCKIDCEGAEFEILLNASPDSLRRVRVYSIEFHEFGGHVVTELTGLFERHGFKCDASYLPSKRGISFGKLHALRQ